MNSKVKIKSFKSKNYNLIKSQEIIIKSSTIYFEWGIEVRLWTGDLGNCEDRFWGWRRLSSAHSTTCLGNSSQTSAARIE
jgi:hypothetical protein